MTGSRFGNYRVEEQIGKGGMGVVYRAIDTKLGRSVAIKVLPEECAKDPARRARFEREARLLAALNHATSRPFVDWRSSTASAHWSLNTCPARRSTNVWRRGFR
jgi:serine/threonine protein kinase